MLLERQARVLRIVLGAHGEQDAAVFQLAQILLQVEKAFAVAGAADADPVEAVLADDASPQRVVEIADDDLARQPRDGADV